MRPIKGYKDVQASGEFERLAPGGYVIKITGAEDAKDEQGNLKEYLRITFDIAEGPEKGRYKDETPDNAYRHQFIRSYKDKALGMFKAFTVAIDESNGSKITDQIETGFDERALIGKILGVVIGYEEYEANDGRTKERMRIVSCMSADRIRKGGFKIPETKKIEGKTQSSGIPEGFTPFTDADIPF